MIGDGGDRSLGIPAFLWHRETCLMGSLLHMLMGTGTEKCIQARSSNNCCIKRWGNLLPVPITPLRLLAECGSFYGACDDGKSSFRAFDACLAFDSGQA